MINPHYYDCIADITERYCKPKLGFNLKLTIICPEYTQDSDGNVTVTDTPSEIYQFRANQIKPPTSELTTGSDRDRVYVEAYGDDPRLSNFDLGDELEGEYLYEGTWIQCFFYPVPRLADNFTEHAQLHRHTGRCVHGYLKLEGVT